MPTSRTLKPGLTFWTLAIASRIGLIRSFAVFGSPRTLNWTSIEWPSAEIWPPPPCLSSGFWRSTALGWLESVCTTSPAVARNAGSFTVSFWLWIRTLSDAGWVIPAWVSIAIAVPASPEAKSESFIWTWPARLPAAVATPANRSQPKSAFFQLSALHAPVLAARFCELIRLPFPFSQGFRPGRARQHPWRRGSVCGGLPLRAGRRDRW